LRGRGINAAGLIKTLAFIGSNEIDNRLEINTKACGGTGATEAFADIVVAAAIGQSLTSCLGIGCKDDTRVVVVALKLAEIQINLKVRTARGKLVDDKLKFVK